MGMVLPAGVGQAPARQAALFAGLPQSVPCLTVNKVCGSGLEAVLGAARARSRPARSRSRVAGGMESMSNAPHAITQAAQRHVRMGPLRTVRYHGPRRPMGSVLEPAHGQLRRAVRDGEGHPARARRTSTPPRASRRALDAIKQGHFKAEIAAVKIADQEGRDQRRDRRRARQAATSRGGAVCAPRSRRTARSPPATHPRSTTVRPRSC